MACLLLTPKTSPLSLIFCHLGICSPSITTKNPSSVFLGNRHLELRKSASHTPKSGQAEGLVPRQAIYRLAKGMDTPLDAKVVV